MLRFCESSTAKCTYIGDRPGYLSAMYRLIPFSVRLHPQACTSMNTNATANPPPDVRTIGLDAHPDTFTAALVRGLIPAQAIVENQFIQVPLSRLETWAKQHLRPTDHILLEASGNSFAVVRRLRRLGFQADVLESVHLGKLKEAHANNDRISAVRIAKAWLAGTAKTVWVPDALTQERRDLMHAHRKSVKRMTQTINRLDSFLSDNGVRLEDSLANLTGPAAQAEIRQAKAWTPRQWIIIEAYLADLESAASMRRNWEQIMAAEVIHDPVALSLTRLQGVRVIVAFYLMAVIGDIQRFARPKSLVKYFGLDPAFDDSGNEQWSGGIGGHGHKLMRSLLLESAQCLLRTDSPLGQWGRKLMARKGSRNLAAAAVARRLTVAIWYLLQGRFAELKELDRSLSQKVGKIISTVGPEKLQALGSDRKTIRQSIVQSLTQGRVYHLHPPKRSTPPDRPADPPHSS